MEEKTYNDVSEIGSRNWAVRAALAAAAILALLFGWFSVRWQLGNLLAEVTGAGETNARGIAELAMELSPGDPVANWLLASTTKKAALSGERDSSVIAFQNLVRLAPNKFNWWLELGRAYEQANQPDNAEKSFLNAVELAPNYTYPHWQLGNFYLRRGNEAGAFAELQKAAEYNAVYREQVFSLAWDYYEQDTARLEALAGTGAAARAGLAKFYAVRERPADSLRMWNTLSADEKQVNDDVAKIIVQGLFEKRFYRQAVDFVKDLGIEPKAAPETVQNGGFEDPIGETDYTYFNWSVGKIEKMDVKRDRTQKKEGDFSLRVTFSGLSKGLFYNIWQVVTVQPAAKYRLSFWLRTENLKSGGTPILEIVNANDDKIITATEAFPAGTNDWRAVAVDFTTPAGAEAVRLRTSRGYCGESCPIVGAFWYDGFTLEKVN